MRAISSQAELQSFHQEIVTLREGYPAPENLMGKVNAEYRGYVTEPTSYYRWLALAVKLWEPKRLLELGNFLGVSTLCLYSELTDELEWFYSADIQKNLAFLPEEVANDPRVTLFLGNDLDLSIFEEQCPTEIDFLFLDTLHTLQQLTLEWEIYRNLLAPGALVILDDIYMGRLIDFFNELEFIKLDVSKDCHASGFGIFIFEPTADELSLSTEARLLRAYRASSKIGFRLYHHLVAKLQAGKPTT